MFKKYIPSIVFPYPTSFLRGNFWLLYFAYFVLPIYFLVDSPLDWTRWYTRRPLAKFKISNKEVNRGANSRDLEKEVKSGVVAHTCKSSTQEAEARGL
jgi:hypothetical protein